MEGRKEGRKEGNISKQNYVISPPTATKGAVKA
jgi:hypothetical protein